MIAQYLWLTGSAVITILAGVHLYYTFYTNKFSSKNKELIVSMKNSSPVLTEKVSMWNAWIGFNGSHSAGGIFIGVLNIYLASRYFDILQKDHFLFLFNLLTIGFYVWLAKRYWFDTPFHGLVICFACYFISYILVLLNGQW
jgi:hypothetical protein